LTLSAGAGLAPAQQNAPLALDPSVASQATTLLVAADQSVLSPGGQSAESITFALARGTRVDTTAVKQLCTRGAAAHAACPETSRIGFGRFILDVRGYVLGGGETQLSWAIDAYLGEAQRHGDAASVVLIGKLLGADSVAALLTPDLGTTVPATTTTVGRLIRRASGAYGVELEFAKLPARLDARAPITATPARLELALSAIRRTRQNFTRRIRLRTPTGYEIRKIPDHRLVGHALLRTPRSCSGSWRSELRVGLPSGVKRTARRMPCQKAGSALPSAALR
jgi:hypothetical protein